MLLIFAGLSQRWAWSAVGFRIGPKEELLSCSVLTQTASLQQEIDFKIAV
jgi:hypothetical protein